LFFELSGHREKKGDKKMIANVNISIDLGRFLKNPSKESLQVFERLTGVDISDIVLTKELKPKGSEINTEIFKQFFDEFCVVDKNSSLLQKTVYAKFEDWFINCIDERSPIDCGYTRQKFSEWFEANQFSRKRLGGQMTICGVSFKK